jgi:hypothetical protein
MSISVQCECGRKLKARDEFAGKRADCPTCGKTLSIPASESAAATFGERLRSGEAEPMEIVEFLDPPSSRPFKQPKRQPISLRVMFEALLDPRSIQWMLMLGGGLVVLGLVILLVSLGFFQNKETVAIAMGIGSLAILGGGWYVTLKTRYHTAGQALTFLGCVVAPLNLWFYHAQGLIRVDENLWMGGVVCCLIYIATVYVLRDPLFMYAVELGATLTAMLLLADLGWFADTTYQCLFLVSMGLASIHFERAFPPGPDGTFTRERFGMPLFWSGHAQLALGLLILLGTQAAGWLFRPYRHFWNWTWAGNTVSQHWELAGAIWLAGVYGYLYSDLVVRRVGIYTYIAAFCLLMSEISFVWRLEAEGVIAVLAATALAANLIRQQFKDTNEKVNRAVPPLALGLSALPVLLGVIIHLRATSVLFVGTSFASTGGPWFVAAMVFVALCNRASAFLFRRDEPTTSAVYFFFSAGSAIVAAAGLLQICEVTNGLTQAAWLMLIPIAYLIGARLWMGHSPERPLVWVSHTASAVILVPVLLASAYILGESVFSSVYGHLDNLMLGIVFSEAAVFYTLAGIFRKRSANVYFAAASTCIALWQFIKYGDLIGDAYYTMLYAVLGLAVLAAGRALGLEEVQAFNEYGDPKRSMRGRGLALFQSGSAILCVALLGAFFQGLANLTGQQVDWPRFYAMSLATIVSYVAITIVPTRDWRRLYWTTSLALTGLCCLTLLVKLGLTLPQKIEIFCVVIGIALIIGGYIGRFRETDADASDGLVMGLWTGSLLVAFPLAIAVCFWRFYQGDPSWQDELAIVVLTILMLVTGFSWRVQATTVIGGGTLFLYLCQFVYSPARGPGTYLAIGGAVVFGFGLVLSMYRDKLLALPDRIAKREGVFQIMGWK